MSQTNQKIAIVIPAYKVGGHICNVLNAVPSGIDYVIVVDDACPEESGKVVEKNSFEQIESLVVLYHQKNRGVGGAVVTGYKKALELGCDVVVKIDGDGQMDLDQIPAIVRPLMLNKADYVKGNRFVDFKALRSMPKLRLIGNSVLSFTLKVVSGNWHIMDPTNGYTEINALALKRINLDEISKRYFFESDMLINLNIHKCVVRDVPMAAFYGDEESSLSVRKVLFQFPFYLLRGFIKRIVLKYFIYDFNMASIYILFGFPMLIWGILFGAYEWWLHATAGTITPTGTVMLSVLPLILGTQLILQAITIDINSIPKKE
ncbi:MAG: glycosyltransferase family 2 protein [Crocinitomicaceae bacterium]|nr:glycosyltransferase family 2 protein [Crocinitomicaceae bacterium]